MYAEVLIQYVVKSLDHTFTYKIPDELINVIEPGMKVIVPFGKNNINGFVLKIKNDCNLENIKTILSIINKDIKLNKELLELGEYISNKTLCTKVSAYQTMLPSSLKVNKKESKLEKYDRFIVLNKSINEVETFIENNKLGPKQKMILTRLINGEKVLKNELLGTSLDKLINLELVRIDEVLKYRLNNNKLNNNKNDLTKEQQEIYDEINNNLNKNETYLIHGITGSGKTEIYMHLCESVINANKSVIMLVPEISLTTQIIERFYNRFGNDVAIFHSELSDGEKYDEYNKILKGEVHVVVGTRSAIFTPVNNLGLIIIDEEHTSSYKQENNPRYHALDIAKWRCEYNKIPLVLGSATPTYETMSRALKGVYKYLPLNKRIGSATLPEVKLIDMQKEYKKGNLILSEELMFNIMKTLEKHEQVMLLLNRRGFSTITTCSSCGYTYKCPNCEITLTYHKTSNKLRCHYCGHTEFMSEVCPECGLKEIRAFGLGTQKVEELLHELYPSYNIVRMDRDTTTKKGSYSKIIKGIENHEYDIVIGTQMISKGLDFPDVTLVGIINADETLNIPDFRSGENTFNLLSQTSGRAGRSNKKGKVLIQTFNMDNKTLLNVLKNDYMANYLYEMDIRKKLKYPPYYYLISIKVASKDYNDASNHSLKIADYLRNRINNTSICLGPTVASNFKINNVYRFQIIIKYRFDDNLFAALKELDELYINNKNVNLEIDIDPNKI